ncbi:MAG: hypothetical protein ACLRVU_01285 [Beduini sp.]|uniref:hypothetical protein n=1 Tax=Beduini sp. TaxID=1922300 RepID=UPI0039A2075F
MSNELNIDKLSIEISADSNKANKSIDELSDSLTHLSRVTGKGIVGLDKIRNQLSNLNNISKNVKAEHFNSIAKAFGSLANSLNGITSIDGAVAKTINTFSRIGKATESLNNVNFTDFSNKTAQLTNAMLPLQNVGKINIGQNISQLNRVPEMISSLANVDTASLYSKMSGISKAMAPLQQISKTNLSQNVNALAKLKLTLSSLNSSEINFSNLASQTQQLASAMEPLQQIGKTNLGQNITQLMKLKDLSASLDGVDFSKLSVQIKNIAVALQPLADVTIKMNGLFSVLPRLLNKSSAGFANYNSNAKKASTINSKFNLSLGSVFNGLKRSISGLRGTFLAITLVAGGIGNLFEESSQYIENLNLFNVAMGSATDSAMQFAQQVQNAMGIDMGEWMKYQGSFNMLISGFGVASDKAQIMSQNLTQLAYDYSSLMNVSVESAFDKLNSAMSGQIKGLKEFGNNVSVAMVKETGLKYGLDGAVASWDQNTQAIMRYITIMENAANVDVFNDMARTLVTPANAVRVLTQQFTMLKRAVGNIASVFISKLIPYVQVFIQLLTKLANFVAGLFGFKLPEIDYSGLAGGGADAEDALDNVGDSASGATDKVKELKKQLMGFDELNILNSPDNSKDSSGSNGSGGGGSIGDIELPQYDFLKGLENSTNEMLDKLEARLKELFKPVSDSWNVYGVRVVDSLKYQFNEIKALVGSIGKSFNDVWQNGTGYETISHLLNIIADLNYSVGNLASQFKIAWETAGVGSQIVQNLWDILNIGLSYLEDMSRETERWTKKLNFVPALKSVSNLSDAFKDLSSVVMSNLSKAYKNILLPFAKWSIERGVPLVVDMLAASIRLLSTILSKFSAGLRSLEGLYNIGSKIAKLGFEGTIILITKAVDGLNAICNTFGPVLSGVTVALGAFFVAWKIDTILNATGKLGILTKAFQELYIVISEIKLNGFSSAFNLVLNQITDGNKAVSSFTSVYTRMNNALLNTQIFTVIGGALSTLAMKLETAAASTGLMATAAGLLSKALAFLAANPLVIVGIALAGIVTALTLFSSKTKDAKDSTERFVEAEKSKKDALDETTKSLLESTEQTKKNAEAAKGQWDTALVYVSQLEKLTGEDGVVSNIKQAQYYVDQLNGILPESVSLTEDGHLAWTESNEAVKENIELLKQKALVEAYEEDYINSMRQRSKVQAELTSAQNAYKQAQLEANQAQQEYNDIIAKGEIPTENLKQRLTDTSARLEATKGTLESANNAWVANQEGINNYEAELKALDGTVESTVVKIKEEYGILDADHRMTMESLAMGLQDLDDKLDESGTRYQEMSNIEREASRVAREQILDDLAQKSDAYDYSYDEMIKALEEKGIYLNTTERKQLEENIKNAKAAWEQKQLDQIDSNYNSLVENETYGVKLLNASEGNLSKYVQVFKEKGDASGAGLISDLAKAVEENGGKVDKNITTILDNIKKKAEELEPGVTVKTEADETSISNAKSAIETSFGGIRFGISSELEAVGGKVTGHLGLFKYASGGMPDMGEIFVAREAGPELVGKINGKTSVANNSQIIEGIEGGVFSGVARAMQMFSGHSGNKTITVISQIDGKVVAKTVFDEHNKEVIQTGESPLLI